MPGPEAEIERLIVKEAEASGWMVRKISFLDIRGAPDRLFGRNHRSIFIEFKRPGKEATLQQLKRHQELREIFGFEVHTCDSIALGRFILGLPG